MDASFVAPRRPGERCSWAQVGVGHHPLHLAFVHGAGELAVVEDVGEVEDGARGRRHRDAVPARDVGRREGADDVETDAGAGLDASRGGDIHIPAAARQAPQRRRRDVAQRRVGTDRGYGGDEAGVLGQVAVPDGVDAPVDGVEAADADSIPPLCRRYPERGELPSGDDPVLPRGERSEPRIQGCLTLCAIIGPKVKLPPRVALQTAPNSRGLRRKWS